jgi:hypothetical protein
MGWIKALNTIHDSRKHLPGDIFEVGDDTAKRLIAKGAAVEAAAPSEAPAENDIKTKKKKGEKA